MFCPTNFPYVFFPVTSERSLSRSFVSQTIGNLEFLGLFLRPHTIGFANVAAKLNPRSMR
jgi:hypothetical protein